jgi:hypothetical protein
MADYATMFDSKWLNVGDLDDAERAVTIARVEPGMVGEGPDAERKPILWFEGEAKPFAANVTNAKTIANLYGRDTENWVGKAITLYPTTTEYKGETVPCVRIRPAVPGRKAAKSHTLPIGQGKKAVRR